MAAGLGLACAVSAVALIAGCDAGQEVEVPAARPVADQPATSPTPPLTPVPRALDALRSAAVEILVEARLATAIAGSSTATLLRHRP